MGLSRSAPGTRMGDMRAVQDCAAALTDIDTPTGALTAQADGTQENATQLVNGINEIGTVAGAADSVQLPPAVAGSLVYVGNSGGADCQVFGKNGRTDTINGTAGATGVSLGTTKNATFFCAVDGKWRMVLTA